MFRSFITFFQLILQGNIEISLENLLWILGLNGLNSGMLGPGGTPYMKGVGMIVVSLRVFWAKHFYI